MHRETDWAWSPFSVGVRYRDRDRESTDPCAISATISVHVNALIVDGEPGAIYRITAIYCCSSAAWRTRRQKGVPRVRAYCLFLFLYRAHIACINLALLFMASSYSYYEYSWRIYFGPSPMILCPEYCGSSKSPFIRVSQQQSLSPSHSVTNQLGALSAACYFY